MKMNNTEKAIYKMALVLLAANNTVTTLEIKNALRKANLGSWYQKDISDVMDKLAQAGTFSYTDNGTYRTYSNTNTMTTNTTSSTTTKATKTPTTTKTSKISRTKAIDLIENSKGHFFTVTFTKKDNTERTMNAQYSKKQAQNQSKLGYITLKDMTKKSPRNVNTQTLKALSIGGKNYIIN